MVGVGVEHPATTPRPRSRRRPRSSSCRRAGQRRARTSARASPCTACGTPPRTHGRNRMFSSVASGLNFTMMTCRIIVRLGRADGWQSSRRPSHRTLDPQRRRWTTMRWRSPLVAASLGNESHHMAAQSVFREPTPQGCSRRHVGLHSPRVRHRCPEKSHQGGLHAANDRAPCCEAVARDWRLADRAPLTLLAANRVCGARQRDEYQHSGSGSTLQKRRVRCTLRRLRPCSVFALQTATDA